MKRVIKNTFTGGFNLLMILALLIGIIFDNFTTINTKGGISFYCFVVFSYMLIVEYKNLQLKELTDEKEED